ncbi:MAG: chromosome segregation protein SMC [Gemmataceae bacterium]
MLKRLELVGFKSFADRTSFDFGPGITAIVGPNGSGKSNIVDAVRWLLGEMSPRSLRTGELAEVIFNGSPSRPSLGMAEVTLTLDNRRRLVPLECDEVVVTRRIYRSGEGEYLINQQPARLRDIRDLFLGSGAGAFTYAIIEQGKVESLIQATMRDRRALFEEAAGISRFRARKTETEHKLEQTAHNLARLEDILRELCERRTQVAAQADKARTFQALSDKYKHTRLWLALVEYRRLRQTSAALARDLQSATESATATAHTLHDLEQQMAQLEDTVGQCRAQAESYRAQETELREGIAAHVAALRAQIGRLDTLAEELRRLEETQHRRRIEADLLAAEIHKHAATVQDAETQAAQAASLAEALGNALAQKEEHQQALAARRARVQEEIWHLVQQAAHAHNLCASLQSQANSLSAQKERLPSRMTALNDSVNALQQALADEMARLESARGSISSLEQQLAQLVQERSQCHELREEIQRRMNDLDQRRGATQSRLEILEKLAYDSDQDRAVQAILSRRAAGDPLLAETILGTVGTLLSVPGEYASLLDLALGDLARALVCRDVERLVPVVETWHPPLSGRVLLLALVPPSLVVAAGRTGRRNRLLQAPPPGEPMDLEDLSALPGFVAHAPRLVRVARDDCSALPDLLLGGWVLVETVAAAREFRRRAPQFSYLTLSGIVVTQQGVYGIGPLKSPGVLGRNSEMHELSKSLQALDAARSQAQAQAETVQTKLIALQDAERSLQAQLDKARAQAAAHDWKRQRTVEELQQLQAEVQQAAQELGRLTDELKTIHGELEAAQQQAHLLDRSVVQMRQELASLDAQAEELASELASLRQQQADARVQLAALAARRDALRSHLDQLRTVQSQKTRDWSAGQARWHTLRSQYDQQHRECLETVDALSSSVAQRESLEQRLDAVRQRLDEYASQRTALAQEYERCRQRYAEQQATVRDLHISVTTHQQQLDQLCARVREDLATDLAQADAEYPPLPPAGLRTLEQEAASLRNELARLGHVNLEALAELEELDRRIGALDSQKADLMHSRTSLMQILARLEEESRNLFRRTLDAVRLHFQELFRKLFGGGVADIVVSDAEHPWETDVDIVARPPGKELRSISLLSGGEKTLAAVALLLAIFRSKPSPFCILDEVDAALDEANTARFAEVLRSFLDQSQFIVVTHSRRTMAAADVLYGITMQESGVSKKISVRYRQWQDEPDAASPGESQRRAA